MENRAVGLAAADAAFLIKYPSYCAECEWDVDGSELEMPGAAPR